jgi:protein O-GlcNAc transferase
MDEALISLQTAVTENPLYGEAFNNLGVLYRDEGQIQLAIQCYDKCLQLTPNSRYIFV